MQAFDAFITVLTSIVLPSVAVIFLTFVPSIIELRRKRDAGPRPIHSSFKVVLVAPKASVINVENAVGGQFIGLKGFSFPTYICNLEA